ncbi:exocyst complex component 6B-like [Oncorhynchus keta]|uniref:exocyst complex component 6B-like n=1 Tax=Oncorhynchus keta TaxID=8018 RepID=UPI00227B1C37|nr:exocyst complex component 6B-like [Oncorhynchus keta]
MASVEIAAEHERILREIESTDTNCIGPTLRSVYDGQEHGVFMGKLDGRIRNHDRDIEKMCNHHFQGFVDSITELLKVRGEAQKLKSQVTETNQRLQEDGKGLLTCMDELRLCRLQQRNIATSIDKFTHCLPVLEMYNKLQEQMTQKRYYPALRTLEQLEQTCLPRAGQYRFCSIMSDNIPRLRTLIRDTAMSQLKDFLESIRKHSDKIGETAMKQAQVQRSLDSAVSLQQRAAVGRRLRKEAGLGAVSDIDGQGSSPMSEQDSGVLDVEDEEDEDEVPGAQELVDFSPVYRCLHIYTVLGSREQFENYYRNQRRKQARLVLQPHSNMHETLEGYRRYFNQIVGFFVVEDHILHTTQGLVNRAYVEELWELALSKTIAALRTHSSYCTDPDLVLDLKNLIVLLADTLQGFGFPVSQLFDMMFEMREQYGEILLKKWNLAFRQVLDQDNFSPIPVATEEEYRQFTSQFPFQDPELDKLPFPKKLPFSEFVPQVYSQLKEFVYACLKYYEDLHLRYAHPHRTPAPHTRTAHPHRTPAPHTRTPAHPHTGTHAHPHTGTPTHRHTHTPAHPHGTPTPAHPHRHTHTGTPTPAHSHQHTHTSTPAHPHTGTPTHHTPAHPHTGTPTHRHTHTPHTGTHTTPTHPHIHTRTPAHAHVCRCVGVLHHLIHQ